MSRIRSKWTKQEVKVHNFLKGRKIKHKTHPNIEGNPDFFIKETNSIVFIDGCFWHKCPRCYVKPKSNKRFWMQKIRKNTERDSYANKKLRKSGFNVTRIWEHEIKETFDEAFNKIIK